MIKVPLIREKFRKKKLKRKKREKYLEKNEKRTITK